MSTKLNANKPPTFSPLSIAPMVDWSDSYFRTFMRILAPHALVYTEMQTTGAIQYNPMRALNYHKFEQPIAIQLGGSNPEDLKRAALQAEQLGFQEINLNLGCPSDRVISGRFGACLMKELDIVIDCLQSIKQVVNIPVSAKTRIGVDNHDSFDFFKSFIEGLLQTNIDKLIVHARKAWLKGLSPKQNRTIPPIRYEYVYQIKQYFPHLPTIINGDIKTEEAIRTHLAQVDGVMLGRLACNQPYHIAKIHHAIYPEVPLISRAEALRRYFELFPEISNSHPNNKSVHRILKPILNLSHGLSGSKAFKQALLSEFMHHQSFRLESILNRLVDMEQGHSISSENLVN